MEAKRWIVGRAGFACLLPIALSWGCSSPPKTLSQLRVGVGVQDISPTVETWQDTNGNGVRDDGEPFDDLNNNQRWDPVWLAGFPGARAATGVHDANEARALSISRGDTRIGVVVLDLIGFSFDDVQRVRTAARAAGLHYDHILVTTTHQHEGQDTLGFWGPDLGTSGIDPAYIDKVIARSVAALSAASSDERPVTMAVARAEAPALTSDSRLPSVIDQSIHVVSFRDGDAVRATVVVWGNHPEVLGGANTAITSDFPHYLRQELETRYPGSTAFYLQGALGGLITPNGAVGCPDERGAETCGNGTFAKAEYIGRTAARAAANALDTAAVLDEDPALAFRRQPFLLPVTNPDIVIAYQIGIFQRGVFDRQGAPMEKSAVEQMTMAELLAGHAMIQSEVNSLTLGPMSLVTVPGEIYPELWLSRPDGSSYVERPAGADYSDASLAPSLQSYMPADKTRVLIGQGNDSIGYFIPRAQFDAQPPYAYVAEGQYGEQYSLGEQTAERIDAAIRLLYQ